MKNVVVFGCGKDAEAAAVLIGKRFIGCFATLNDRHPESVNGIKVISAGEIGNLGSDIDIVVSCDTPEEERAAVGFLNGEGLKYIIFEKSLLNEKERLISYSSMANGEDIVLYEALRDVPDVFYVDVGCNDPYRDSVTKLLYDMLAAHGINIDPLADKIALCERERPRDINLCLGVGDEPGEMNLYVKDQLSTFKSEFITGEEEDCRKVPIMRLRDIMDEYAHDRSVGSGEMHLLKIDVEGFEKNVIMGADFKKYRPWIMLIESTLPCTDTPAWGEWEKIVLRHGYHFVKMIGVNRYYVADERHELDDLFLSRRELSYKYDIFYSYIVPINYVQG